MLMETQRKEMKRQLAMNRMKASTTGKSDVRFDFLVEGTQQ